MTDGSFIDIDDNAFHNQDANMSSDINSILFFEYGKKAYTFK